jgi:hypothetical protein
LGMRGRSIRVLSEEVVLGYVFTAYVYIAASTVFLGGETGIRRMQQVAMWLSDLRLYGRYQG